MKTRGIVATPKQQSSDYIYDDPNPSPSLSSKPSSPSSHLGPLVQCPECPKSFAQLRSLYGHFGRSHSGMKLYQDLILYGCPYCQLEDVEFMTLDDVAAHVEGYHEGLELLIEKTAKGMAGYSSGGSLKSAAAAAAAAAAATAAAATAPADNQGSKVASAHYNLSEDIEVEENNESSSSPKQSKLTSHPLAKCPSCPKVLLLRGIFGHFGRVHSSIKFDWSKVTYLCPFCDADGKECGMYTTFEETQAHVEEEHEGCALVPITPSTRGNSNSEVDVSEKEASPPVLRMSQRKRTSVSMAEEAEQQPQPTLPPANKRGIQTTLYQCPSCERTFNKQGLATHYGMVHSKTLDWNKVQISQNETRTYICPECERSFSKGGLTTHFGMMHDGRLDWTKVKLIGGGGGGGITLKRKRETDVESSDEEEGEGGEDEEGPVRKSRRISARAMSRSADEEDGDFVTYDSAASAGGGSVSSNNAPALNFGPWTPDEHEAFLIGHRKHGNSWSLISQHFVPTRTAKQIGSHALAYFTTQGQWEGRNGPRKSTGEEDRPANHKDVTCHDLMVQLKAKEKRRKSAAVDTSEDQIRRSAWSDEEHAAFIEGHKKLGNAWMLISKLYVPSRTPKQVGSHALHHFTAIGKWEEAKKSKRDPSIYENINNMDESSSNGQSDDGNFDYCIVCEDGGVLICCSDCPRSYHRSCIDNNTSTLPLTWTCERCQTDYDVLPHEEIPTDAASADIQSTYSKFMYSEGFEKCCELLTKLSFIVAQLKDADHGYIFAEPVDLQIVPQYTLKVDTPMDYSTILSKINKGTYATNLKSHDMKRPMEAIVLHVMYDVELVHKNCSTFNPKGSSVYRAGISQSKKWSAYFKKYLLPSLPSTVSWAYQNGLSDTEQTEQQEGIQCKQPKSPKKSKRVDASSSGVILTKEQIDSFETIYFSSAADLTEPIGASSEASRVVTQWFERLEDLRKHKVLHGTGIVTTGLDDKLYQWIIRQRKRFHLTLHYNPQFRSERYAQMLPSDSSNEREEDVAWLMKSPPMTGTFALLSPPRAKNKVQSVTPAPKEREDVKAIARDIKTSKVIQDMHQKTLYFPVNSSPPYRHSSSLFWDESLEALRFFHGEYKHTIVPRSYPHDELLSLWVEIQRAKLLLNLVGLDSGLLGAQVHVLDDEIHLCEVFAAGNAVSNQNHHSIEDAIEDFDDMHEDVDQNNTTEEATPPPVQSIDIPVEASPIEVHSADKSSELEMGANEGANATGEKGEEDKAQVEGGVVQESVPSAAEPEGDGAEDEKEREVDASPTPPESETSEKDSGKETRVPLCKCPACEKSFDTLRKLYGHFGSAHARIKGLKIATNEVFFECPWCKDGVFKPLEEIEAHVKESHGKNCQLSKSEYKSSSAPKKEKVIRPKAKPKLQPTVTPTAPKKVSPFKRHLNEFIAWYKQHPFPILETMNKELYLWCWKQCNGAAALLSGSPNVSNTKLNMNATKLKLLASNGFFRVFSYTDKAMVYEDDYEGSDDWDAAFNSVETFSINHGSTHIPDYIHVISGDKRAWISEVHDELRRFVKGEHCALSTRQIEQLILIGFCTDRSDLPNLTRSDVIWLKRFRELKQYQLVFGDCHVTEDFLELHQWVTEQRKLFRLFRMGNDALLKIERLQMLMDAGVDFFTSDYFPFLTQDDIMKFETQISTPPDLFHGSSLPHVINDDFSEDDYSSKFDSMKAANGHSLVLADEHLDVYQWHIAMRSALLSSYAARHEAGSPNSPLRHLVLNCVKDNDSAAPDDKFFKSKESLVLWSKYCERFMMFLAVKGHGHIPKDYPDIALVQWLSKQQDDLYHCSKHPNNTELPIHLKLLTSLGVQAKKRHVQPIFSTRILRRKSPIKSKTKKLIVA